MEDVAAIVVAVLLLLLVLVFCALHTLMGTLKREFFGMPPIDKPISIIGFDLFRISSEVNKIVEMWQQFSNGKWS